MIAALSVTVVTPTIDSSIYLDEAIASVPRDEGATIEHIIIHDGDPAFLTRLRHRYPWLRLLQGPGRGATAAVAQAIRRAQGEFIILLNSDDRLASGAIAALARAVRVQPDARVWTGHMRIFRTEADGREVTLRTVDYPETMALTLLNAIDDLPLMTARIVHRSVFATIGNWNPDFSACSDRELAIRMVIAGVSAGLLDAPVSELRAHDDSMTTAPVGSTVPGYLAEHVMLARRWMTAQDISDQARAIFRNWHARELLRKLYYELRLGNISESGRTIRSALAADPTWPWRAGSALAAARRRRRKR
jgi:GT2 family glycosyltransferase